MEKRYQKKLVNFEKTIVHTSMLHACWGKLMMNHTLPSQQRLRDVLFFKHENTQQPKTEDTPANDQALFYEEPCYGLNFKCVVSTLQNAQVHYTMKNCTLQVSHCT